MQAFNKEYCLPIGQGYEGPDQSIDKPMELESGKPVSVPKTEAVGYSIHLK